MIEVIDPRTPELLVSTRFSGVRYYGFLSEDAVSGLREDEDGFPMLLYGLWEDSEGIPILGIWRLSIARP